MARGTATPFARRGQAGEDEAGAALEEGRAHLVAARDAEGAEDEGVAAGIETDWRGRLGQLRAQKPDAAEELRQLLTDLVAMQGPVNAVTHGAVRYGAFQNSQIHAGITYHVQTPAARFGRPARRRFGTCRCPGARRDPGSGQDGHCHQMGPPVSGAFPRRAVVRGPRGVARYARRRRRVRGGGDVSSVAGGQGRVSAAFPGGADPALPYTLGRAADAPRAGRCQRARPGPGVSARIES